MTTNPEPDSFTASEPILESANLIQDSASNIVTDWEEIRAASIDSQRELGSFEHWHHTRCAMAKLTVFAALSVAWFMNACGTIHDCADRSMQISTGDTALVKSITLSGPGCDNATVDSDMPSPAAQQSVNCGKGFTAYCQYYYISPHAAGPCTVQVVLENGETLENTTEVVYSNGEHCAGYFMHPTRWFLFGPVEDAGAN